jgi:hypothetical protein
MLEGLQPPKRNFSCKVNTLKDELEDKDYKILLSAIDSDKAVWPAKTLSNELSKRGVHLVDTTITKHRLKQCWCYRDK